MLSFVYLNEIPLKVFMVKRLKAVERLSFFVGKNKMCNKLTTQLKSRKERLQ